MKLEAIQKLASDLVHLLSERAAEQDAKPAPPLLSARDVASRLQTNTQAVYRLAREGKLPAVQLGSRTLRWTDDAVNGFIARGGIAVEQRGNAPQKNLRLAG